MDRGLDNTKNDKRKGIYPLDKYNGELLDGTIAKTDRIHYYVELGIHMFDDDMEIPVKIDTGSPVTMIGINFFSEYDKNKIQKIKPVEEGTFKDASNTDLTARRVVTDRISIAGFDIEVPMYIYVSDELGSKAVLGMDILTMFQFSYTFDGSNGITNGTLFLHDTEKTLERIKRFYEKRPNEPIVPNTICLIDDDSQNQQELSLEESLARLEANMNKEEEMSVDILKPINKSINNIPEVNGDIGDLNI